MEWNYVGAVVISGLVLVFLALILLIIAVSVMGKIFDAMAAKKKKAVPEKAPAVVKAPAVIPLKQAPVANNAPVDAEDEIVAVIAAAVAAMAEESGKNLRITGIRPAAQGKTRSNAWARAAAAENTRSF